MMYVYCIINKINFKKYIGKTENKIPNIRWKAHISKSKNNSKSTIHCAIRKYGIKNFTFKVIDQCISSDELVVAEIEWIKKLDTYKNGYNMSFGGESGSKGYKHTKEWKKETSKRMKNNTYSVGNTIRKGCKLSNKTKELLRKANFGKKLTKEHKNNIGKSSKGRKHTEETKKKLSKINSGIKHPMFGKFGLEHPNSKIIIQIDNNTKEEIMCWFSSICAERELNIGKISKHISSVCRGKRKSTGGFGWKYGK